MNFIDTYKGSRCENYFPKGWDLEKIDKCCSYLPKDIGIRQSFWNEDFNLISCDSLFDFNMMFGHEIAFEIKRAKDDAKKLILVLPVGPMGMYRWVIYFLKKWGVDCSHVFGFNMDEWSDREGNTADPTNPGSFQTAMEQAFYGPLEELTVPEAQRNFATKENLPLYSKKISELKASGARQITIFGVGRSFHVAFWEPHFAEDFNSVEEWKTQEFRIGAQLHPLTVEQNSVTSFKGRTTLVPCYANTIGPGIFLNSDRTIGGFDGIFGRGMQWQGISLWVTLRHGPDMWIPGSFMPTVAGNLFYMKEFEGPLVAECN